MKTFIVLSFIFCIIKSIIKDNQIVNIMINCDICCDIFDDLNELNLSIKNANNSIELINSHKKNVILNVSKNNSLILSYNNFTQNHSFYFNQNSICNLIEMKNNIYEIKNILIYSKNTSFLLENFSFSKSVKFRKLTDCSIEYSYNPPNTIIAGNPITINVSPKYQCYLQTNPFPTITFIGMDSADGNSNIEANFLVFIPSDKKKYTFPEIFLDYKLQCYNDSPFTCKANISNKKFIICPSYCYNCSVILYTNYYHKECYSEKDFNDIKTKIDANPSEFNNEKIVNNNEFYFFHSFPVNYYYKENEEDLSSIYDKNHYYNKYCSRILKFYYLYKGNRLMNEIFKIESYGNINDNSFKVKIYNQNYNSIIQSYECKNFSLQAINLTFNEHSENINFLDYITPDYEENHLYYLRVKLLDNIGYSFQPEKKQFGSMYFKNGIKYDIGNYEKANQLIYKRNGYYYNEIYDYKILYELVIQNDFFLPNNYNLLNHQRYLANHHKIVYDDNDCTLHNSLNITVYPYYCYNVNLWSRICYTNYSFTSIQQEIEVTDLEHLHEHLYETIHGDNFEVKIYCPRTSEVIEPHLRHIIFTFPDDYPLSLCPDVYNNYAELIIIQYKYENEYFYEMYDKNKHNHRQLDIGICYENTVTEDNFTISSDENIIFKVNDYIEPQILDNNQNTSFYLSVSDFGIGDISELNIPYNYQKFHLNSTKKEFIYITNDRFYYKDILYLRIQHGKQYYTKKMEGNYLIYVLPNYCNKLLSKVEGKICYTKDSIDLIKNKIFKYSHSSNFSDHENEKIYGINYNLHVIKKDLENCSSIYTNFYNTNDFLHFHIKYENKEYTEIYANIRNTYYLVNQELCNGIYLQPKIIEINHQYIFKVLNDIKDLIPSFINLDETNVLEQYSFNIYKKIDSNYVQVFPKIRNLELITSNNFDIIFTPDDNKYYNVTFKYVLTNKFKSSKFEEMNIQSEITFIVFPSYCESHNQMICNSNTNLENILTILDNDYKNLENHNGEIIKNNDFYLQINDINNNKKNYVEIVVGFDNCKQKIRNKYNLKEKDEIYIINIKKSDLDKMTFKIYSPSIPNELEIKDICQYIEVETPIHFNYNYTEYIQLLNQGIDVFNINSPFYNNLCKNYQIKKKDILLYDRLYTLYPNISVCSVNCDYQSFDLQNALIKCFCPIEQIINLNIYGNYINFSQQKYVDITKFKRNKNYFKNFNFKVLKCIKAISDNITINIGFWIMIILLMIQFIASLTYLYYSMHTLNHIIKIPFINSYIEKKKLFGIKNKNNPQFSSTERQLNNIKFDFNHKNLDLRILPNKIIYELNNYSISYSYALYKEKRTSFEMFNELIKEKIPILKAYFTIYIFELNSINVSLAVIHISLIFNLNIVFYNNNIVSKRFFGESHFIYDFIRIILSSILTKFIFSFFKTFNSYIHLIEQLIFELKTKRSYVNTTARFLKKIKIKLGIFMGMNFLIVLFFFFYSSTFCVIYQENQMNWFIGGLISLSLNYLFIFIFCILIVYWRQKSLRMQDEQLYNISTIIKNNI